MATVAELQQQLTTAQNALKAGQITQSQYNQFYYKQTTLIAQAKQQEGTSASPLPKDPTDPAGSYNTQTTNTGGSQQTWIRSATDTTGKTSNLPISAQSQEQSYQRSYSPVPQEYWNPTTSNPNTLQTVIGGQTTTYEKQETPQNNIVKNIIVGNNAQSQDTTSPFGLTAGGQDPTSPTYDQEVQQRGWTRDTTNSLSYDPLKPYMEGYVMTNAGLYHMDAKTGQGALVPSSEQMFIQRNQFRENFQTRPAGGTAQSGEQQAKAQKADFEGLSTEQQKNVSQYYQQRQTERMANLGLMVVGGTFGGWMLGATGSIMAAGVGMAGEEGMSLLLTGKHADPMNVINAGWRGVAISGVFKGVSEVASIGLMAYGARGAGFTQVFSPSGEFLSSSSRAFNVGAGMLLNRGVGGAIGNLAVGTGVGAGTGYVFSGGKPEEAAKGALVGGAFSLLGSAVGYAANRLGSQRVQSTRLTSATERGDITIYNRPSGTIARTTSTTTLGYIVRNERMSAADLKIFDNFTPQSVVLGGQRTGFTESVGTQRSEIQQTTTAAESVLPASVLKASESPVSVITAPRSNTATRLSTGETIELPSTSNEGSSLQVFTEEPTIVHKSEVVKGEPLPASFTTVLEQTGGVSGTKTSYESVLKDVQIFGEFNPEFASYMRNVNIPTVLAGGARSKPSVPFGSDIYFDDIISRGKSILTRRSAVRNVAKETRRSKAVTNPLLIKHDASVTSFSGAKLSESGKGSIGEYLNPLSSSRSGVSAVIVNQGLKPAVDSGTLVNSRLFRNPLGDVVGVQRLVGYNANPLFALMPSMLQNRSGMRGLVGVSRITNTPSVSPLWSRSIMELGLDTVVGQSQDQEQWSRQSQDQQQDSWVRQDTPQDSDSFGDTFLPNVVTGRPYTGLPMPAPWIPSRGDGRSTAWFASRKLRTKRSINPVANPMQMLKAMGMGKVVKYRKSSGRKRSRNSGRGNVSDNFNRTLTALAPSVTRRSSGTRKRGKR